MLSGIRCCISKAKALFCDLHCIEEFWKLVLNILMYWKVLDYCTINAFGYIYDILLSCYKCFSLHYIKCTITAVKAVTLNCSKFSQLNFTEMLWFTIKVGYCNPKLSCAHLLMCFFSTFISSACNVYIK